MLYLFYVTKYVHVIHTLASHLWDKQGNWGQSGVDVSKPAGYAVCDGNMSSYFSFLFFFSLLFKFWVFFFPFFPKTWNSSPKWKSYSPVNNRRTDVPVHEAIWITKSETYIDQLHYKRLIYHVFFLLLFVCLFVLFFFFSWTEQFILSFHRHLHHCCDYKIFFFFLSFFFFLFHFLWSHCFVSTSYQVHSMYKM